jgi:multiple sugar transport system permease protein
MSTKTSVSGSTIVSREKKRAVAMRTQRFGLRTRWVRWTFLLPAILYILLFYGYPLYYSFSVSFERYDLQAEITGMAPFVGLTNYLTVFHNPVFQSVALHTLFFTVGSIFPQFVIGLALAILFTRRFPLNRLLRSLFLLPWLLPLVVSATIWRWLFDQTNGIIDQLLAGLHLVPAHFGWLTTPVWALVAVTIANIWIGIPFNMVIIYSGLQSIAREFYEAAAIDGANGWQAFRYITLPLLEPVIGIVLMLGLIYTLKVFDIIYVMTGGGPANASQTLATWSYNLSFSQQLFGQGAALGNVILLIALAIAVVYVWWSGHTAKTYA